MEGSGIGQFIPLILIFVIFYFFLIRPQQKKVKEHKAIDNNFFISTFLDSYKKDKFRIKKNLLNEV